MRARGVNGQITAALHGVQLTLHSERPDFLSSARDYLAPLIGGHEGASQINVHIGWDAGSTAGMDDRSSEGLVQLGRRLWAGPSHLRLSEAWQLPGLAMDVTWDDDTLIIRAVHTWPSRRAKWLAALLPRQRTRLYTAVIYYLGYFAWAWWLERKRGWTVHHAAAVSASAKSGMFEPHEGVVLGGLPGCGKSTTALAFLSQPEWQVVSDNLVFTDGRRVYACTEPIHMDDKTLALIGGDCLHGRLRSTGRRFSYGRQDYEVAAVARAPYATPRAVGFLHVGQETAIRRLASHDGMLRLLANDCLAKEWLAYQESAASIHQVWPEVGNQERRLANLAALTQSVPCYEVTVNRGEEVSRAVSTILQAMEVDI